jgi:MoxR-like ATPase
MTVPTPAESDAPWDFADDDAWVEYISDLKEDGALDIWNTDVRPSLTAKPDGTQPLDRVRAALKEVQTLVVRDGRGDAVIDPVTREPMREPRFLNRDKALEMMAACAIAQTNLVFLGPPGTAKSLLVRSFAQSLGVRPIDVPIKDEDKLARLAEVPGQPRQRRRLFEYLLTRFTTPEELFGGTDINVLLKSGAFCRRTTGMLPQADIVFLDEIFKANSAILNSLLSLTNERIFYNMGQAFKVNLAFTVGASNETPDESELGALYDRFPIRVPCHPIPEDEDEAAKLVDAGHRFHSYGSLGNKSLRISRKACLNDIRLLSKVLLGGAYGGTTAFPKDNPEFRKAFLKMFLTIRREYGVSDRTPSLLLRVCRALALLEKAEKLSYRHLRAWAYVAPKFEETGRLQKMVHSMIVGWDPGAQTDSLFDRA